jgi:hypothetical protein
VNIAKQLGCSIVSWKTTDEIDDEKYVEIKNTCWNGLHDGAWVIVGDMDEWLCITEHELEMEDNKGCSILNIEGYNMVAESQMIDLSDIDIHNLTRAVTNWTWESKRLCFKKGPIQSINYSGGAHFCEPIGDIRYSERTYINKHVDMLGLEYFKDKILKRFLRKKEKCPAEHYTDDISKIESNFYNMLNNSVSIV